MIFAVTVFALLAAGYYVYRQAKTNTKPFVPPAQTSYVVKSAPVNPTPTPAVVPPPPSAPASQSWGTVVGPDGIDHSHLVTGEGHNPSDGFTPHGK